MFATVLYDLLLLEIYQISKTCKTLGAHFLLIENTMIRYHNNNNNKN